VPNQLSRWSLGSHVAAPIPAPKEGPFDSVRAPLAELERVEVVLDKTAGWPEPSHRVQPVAVSPGTDLCRRHEVEQVEARLPIGQEAFLIPLRDEVVFLRSLHFRFGGAIPYVAR
jgi:hypothetical protein